MYLFIDTISDPTFIALFDEKRHIVDTQTWSGKQHEFDTLTEEIHQLLEKNHIPYKVLSGIIVMVGPGSFTGTRVTTLVANALNYGFNTHLFPLTVSEFFSLQNAPFPWITSVTKKEVLLWNTKEAHLGELRQISELPETKYSTLGPIDFGEKKSSISLAHDYPKVIKNLSLEKYHARIQPLYAKDPNVTKML